ncbi:MAG: hypothetical protein D3905_07785 [Candidatus Electrothrix sp. AS4_5]|nr:hypothetical protein [Candidatus Electrothrix gigas]
MAIDISICPKCKGKYQSEKIECPNCGIIFKRYKKQQDDAFKKLLQSVDDIPFEEVRLKCGKIVKTYPSLRGKCIKFLVALQAAMNSLESKEYEKAIELFDEISVKYPYFTEAKRKVNKLTENTEDEKTLIEKNKFISTEKKNIGRVIHRENFQEKLFIEYFNSINNFLPKNRMVVIYILISLLTGYFVGREHMKYEIKNVIIAGAESVAKGFGKGFLNNPLPNGKNTDTNQTKKYKNKVTFPVKILEKKFVDDKYKNYIYISLQFKNTLKRNIRAYQGVLEISDVLENEIISVNLKHQDMLQRGENFIWKGSINYNQFIDRHIELRNTSLKDLNVKFFLNKVIYDDGSSESFI